MWPRQKTLFLVPHGTEDWHGFLSLLEALHKDVVIKETSGDVPMDLTGLTCPVLEQDLEDLSGGGPTEILHWPGISMEDGYRQWGLSQGLSQEGIMDFQQRLWEGEIILPIQTEVLFQEDPLLWKILDGAGFEPSLLWKGRDGQWSIRRGRGLHWLVSREWLDLYCEGTSCGREPQRMFTESYWAIQDHRVDFYQDREAFLYLGSFERCVEHSQEEQVYNTILEAIQLGVPWRSIQKSLKGLFRNPNDKQVDQEMCIRWHVDDTQRDAGTRGSELPSEEIEYVEDRRIG